MAHVEKYTMADVTGIFIHYDRSPGHSLSNKDIDKSRTHLNYNLAAADQPMPQKKFLRIRLKQIKTNGRKNQNVMVDWVITQPTDVKETDSKRFFQEVYRFLIDRYGVQNVISAYVHMDEVGNTPHMHFSFIPVETLEDGTEKLNAKAVINRTELQKFHKELQAAMDVRMGYHISITSGITKAQGGNKTISQLKAETKLMEELPQGKKKLLSQDVSYSPEEDRHLKELAAQGISYLVEKDAIDEDRKKFQASAAAINSKDRLLKEKESELEEKEALADLIIQTSCSPSAKAYPEMVKDNERLVKYAEQLNQDLHTVAVNVGSEIMKEIPIQTSLNYNDIPEEPSRSVMKVIQGWFVQLKETLHDLKDSILNMTARVHIFSRNYEDPEVEDLKDDVDMELPDFIDKDEIEARAEDLLYSANQYYR